MNEKTTKPMEIRRNASYGKDELSLSDRLKNSGQDAGYEAKCPAPEQPLKTDILAQNIKSLFEKCEDLQREINYIKTLIFEG